MKAAPHWSIAGGLFHNRNSSSGKKVLRNDSKRHGPTVDGESHFLNDRDLHRRYLRGPGRTRKSGNDSIVTDGSKTVCRGLTARPPAPPTTNTESVSLAHAVEAPLLCAAAAITRILFLPQPTCGY